MSAEADADDDPSRVQDDHGPHNPRDAEAVAENIRSKSWVAHADMTGQDAIAVVTTNDKRPYAIVTGQTLIHSGWYVARVRTDDYRLDLLLLPVPEEGSA